MNFWTLGEKKSSGLFTQCYYLFAGLHQIRPRRELDLFFMNTLYNINSSADFSIAPLNETELMESHGKLKFQASIPRHKVNETIPGFLDFFDFLRENRLGEYDSLPLGYVILDENGIVKSANWRVSEMLEVEKSQLLNRNFIGFIHEEDKKKIKLDTNRFPDYGNQFVDIRFKKKQDLLWARVAFHNDATVFPHTRQIGLVILDIDDLKQVEQENEKLKYQLQQTQKMEAIGELSSGIVHDFNNILHPIIGSLEILMENTDHDRKLRKVLNNILKGANRASTLAKQILSFSHRSEIEIGPVKVQSIIREVIKLSRSTLPATIKIIQTIDNGCGPVMADSTQLYQIAMNLITNAAYAMRHGDGILDVRLNEVEVIEGSCLSLKPGTYICLGIADTGDGIDVSIVNRVFEPYFTTKKQGTGLGLSVISSIVNNYGGDIHFSSKAGEGSLFKVYIPRCKVSFDEILSMGDSRTDLDGTDSILLVDDDPFIVEFQQEVFENHGYQVTPFVSGPAAVKAFKARPKAFDIVLCDMTMPAMTGLDLAIEIKQIRPDVPVVICTGFSEKINKNNYQDMGIDGFLAKPFSKEITLELIRHILDNK